MKALEEEPMIGVTMFKNLFIEINENIDYVQLLNYIDWMVSKPDYTNFRDKGTIPSEIFSDYWIKDRVLDFVPTTIEAEPQEPNIESVAVSGPNVDTTALITSGMQYAPIGRAGTFDGESVVLNNIIWIWDTNVEEWFEERTDGGN
jgi:hypothetical protein